MDDTRTQDTLDTLADLFLTGTVPSRRAPAGAEQRLEGPAPLRMAPKPIASAAAPAAPTPAVTPPPAEPAKPALRLHRDDEDAAAAQTLTADAAALRIEAVVLGNLPGFGAPWLTQYAHYLASDAGVVGLVHVDEQAVDIELVSAAGDALPLRPLAPGNGMPLERKSLLDTIRDLATADHAVTHWLVHLASPDTAAARQLARDLPRWTILTGADDPALVAAYRTLKQLLESHGETSASASPQVGLMIMGSDEATSRAAAAKFQSTAGNFLRLNIEMVGSRRQMAPVERQDIGSFAALDADWPQIVAFFAEHAPATPEPVSHPEIAPTLDADDAQPIESADELVDLTDVDDVDDPDDLELVDADLPAAAAPAERSPVAPEPPRVQASAKIATESPARPPRREPTTATTERPSPQPARADASEPDLVALLTQPLHPDTPATLPGGIAMDARCPRQPQTRLMLDQDGQLHLLRRVTASRTSPVAQQLANVKAAVVDLLEAAAWAREHIDVLQLTQRQLRINTTAEPQPHLFTDDPAHAATLAQSLNGKLKVHVIQQVRIANQSMWIATALN